MKEKWEFSADLFGFFWNFRKIWLLFGGGWLESGQYNLGQAKGKELGHLVKAGKIKKQADFGCFNGLCMLLWDKSLDVCVSGLALIIIFEKVE